MNVVPHSLPLQKCFLHTGYCQGHDTKMTSNSQKTSMTGSINYYMKRPPPDQSIDIYEESIWLGIPCTSNADCTQNYSECFEGRCLCTPGYYFSHCRDSCLPDCPPADLQATFVRYPKRHIKGNNMETVDDCLSFEHGRQRCLKNNKCRSFDLEVSLKTCWLQNITALTAPSFFEIRANSEYCQRTCL